MSTTVRFGLRGSVHPANHLHPLLCDCASDEAPNDRAVRGARWLEDGDCEIHTVMWAKLVFPTDKGHLGSASFGRRSEGVVPWSLHKWTCLCNNVLVKMRLARSRTRYRLETGETLHRVACAFRTRVGRNCPSLGPSHTHPPTFHFGEPRQYDG